MSKCFWPEPDRPLSNKKAKIRGRGRSKIERWRKKENQTVELHWDKFFNKKVGDTQNTTPSVLLATHTHTHTNARRHTYV